MRVHCAGDLAFWSLANHCVCSDVIGMQRGPYRSSRKEGPSYCRKCTTTHAGMLGGASVPPNSKADGLHITNRAIDEALSGPQIR